MAKDLEKFLKESEKRIAKRVGIARLRTRNGAVLEFDLIPPRDSIIRYPEGVTVAVIRRPGYMIKAHIISVYLYQGTLIYEGDIFLFSSPFKFKKFKKPVKKALKGV